MSDSIKKDDEKFNDLLKKQGTFTNEPTDDLDKLDDKMEDMMMIQEISNNDVPEYESVEEKYEIELLLKQFGKKIMENFKIEDIEDMFPLEDEENP